MKLKDLPPVEDLQITENVTNLQKIGKILHPVIAPERNEFFVIVQSDGNSNPLDEDSVLFLSSGEPLGKIHDIFGNVNKPNYIVRYNKSEDIDNKGVTQNQDVYYSPSNGELTHYVLVDNLKQHKGSDASWKDDNEPPDDQIDYSDDEQEKLAKQKQKAKNRKNNRNLDSEKEAEDTVPSKMEKRHVTYNQERASQARPSRSSPHPFPRSIDSTPSPPSNIIPGTSGLQRNALLSQPCGPMSSNSRFGLFSQRSVPPPQSFEAFPPSSVPSPQSFGAFPPSSVPSPQSFGAFPPSSVPSPQSFGALPVSSVPPSRIFGSFPQRSAPLPQNFGAFPFSSVPPPRPLRHVPQGGGLTPPSFSFNSYH